MYRISMPTLMTVTSLSLHVWMYCLRHLTGERHHICLAAWNALADQYLESNPGGGVDHTIDAMSLLQAMNLQLAVIGVVCLANHVMMVWMLDWQGCTAMALHTSSSSLSSILKVLGSDVYGACSC